MPAIGPWLQFGGKVMRESKVGSVPDGVRQSLLEVAILDVSKTPAGDKGIATNIDRLSKAIIASGAFPQSYVNEWTAFGKLNSPA